MPQFPIPHASLRNAARIANFLGVTAAAIGGARLAVIADSGFSVVTLIPEFEVLTQSTAIAVDIGSGPRAFRRVRGISTARTPSMDKIAAAGRSAIERGLHLRLAPHVDADVLFAAAGGESYWRALLLFDPTAALSSCPVRATTSC